MKKRYLTAALLMALSLGLSTACTTDETPATTTADTTAAADTEVTTAAPVLNSEGVTLKVMLMPQGDIDSATKAEVTEKISAVTKATYGFDVEFVMSGDAWNFGDQITAMQTGISGIDIMPAHSWSGITYVQGSKDGQWVRLDDPNGEYGNLLEQYGQDIYGKASAALVSAATVVGADGKGIYGYLVEKDSVSQLGYMMNTDILAKYNFTTDDFKAADFANWGDKLKVIKDGEGANFFPLNFEAEVGDRAVTNLIYVDKTVGPLGISFDNNNPAGTNMSIVARHERQEYKDYVAVMNGYYQAGYVNPELGAAATAPEAIAKARTSGNYAISSFVYAPGYEKVLSEECGQNIAWVPSWSTPIGSTESFMGAGLAVYAGSKNVPQAVQFLNLINTNKEFADLLSEGIKDKSYTDNGDGSITRTENRGGWNIWRYGVVGDISAATPLSSPTEWTDFKQFNDASAAVECLGFLFDRTPVELDLANAEGSIEAYSVPLGSGAANVGQVDTLISELKAANIDNIIAEANSQYSTWKAAA